MFEDRRQIAHFLLGVAILLLVDYIAWYWFLALTLLALLFSYAEKHGFKIIGIQQILNYLERPAEKKRIRAQGLIFYLAGVTIVLLVYPLAIAKVGIAVLAAGDAVATIIGKRHKRKDIPWNHHKSILGTISGFVAAFLFAWIFAPLQFALIAAFWGMLVESFEMHLEKHNLDDNVVVPLAAGFFL